MDGFYPGEVMQFVNKHVHGRQEVGHIDLLARQSYIEVPQEDAAMVMKALDGSVYKGRKVRCNDANEGRPQREDRKEAPRRTSRPGKSSWGERAMPVVSCVATNPTSARKDGPDAIRRSAKAS